MNKKILVVDDSPSIIDLLRIRLGSRGYFVLTACNGKEAMDIYHSQELDLIILDITMPEMGGDEVLKTIRKLELAQGIERGKGIPIIMLTVNKEAWMDSFTDGCSSYVLKTYGGNKILEKVEEALK
ncbi:MAG: response regulator [Candidatus Omnitrophica bacterium]|nr:response regulator [Candidatus Omnitrophota bacterium]